MTNNEELLLKEAISMIDNRDNIYIISHINPDGDSIGSVLALGLALKKNGYRNITLLIPDEIPKNLLFLPNVELIKNEIVDSKIDLLIALDCGDKSRLGISKSLLESTNFIINIDHHITNTGFGDINIINSNSSSTGEIVYQIIEFMNIDLDKDIATSLYTAISTDTGSFKYDNTTSTTHTIVARLLDVGIDINFINIHLYQSRSIEKTNLLIMSLNTLELFNNGKIAIVSVTREMLRNCKASIDDTDVVVDFIRDIDTVEVACVLKEIDDNIIKIGFRSKNYIDVSLIAKIFNGGGHAKASGCILYSNIKEGKKMILKEIDKAFRWLYEWNN